MFIDKIRPVSLLLLDLQMPKKNGIEVFKEVREFFKQINNMAEDDVQVLEPKIVFLTSYLTPGLRHHFKNLGCNYCYDKPLQLQELRDILADEETF